jgi:fido (protein-threonine AMPylation protein)
MSDRHSKLDDVPPRPSLTDAQAARQAAENGFRQFDRLSDLIRRGIREYSSSTFKLRPSTLQELDRLAVNGMVDGPGHFRRGPISIGGAAKHKPPDADDVARHVEDMCDYVNDNWGQSAVHLAAYVMWRLNWIHPFDDGNGRTSRAASYLLLCVRLRAELPGTKTVPELIAANKQPYYEALEAADEADRNGHCDVSLMEALLQRLLIEQVSGAATGEASRSSKPVGTSRSTTKVQTATSGGSDDLEHKRWLGTNVITVVTVIILALAGMLATADGQRLLGCRGTDDKQDKQLDGGQP